MGMSVLMTSQKAGRVLPGGHSEHAAVCAVIALISVPTLDSLKAQGRHCVRPIAVPVPVIVSSPIVSTQTPCAMKEQMNERP